MGLICKLKGHDWKNGRCTRCKERHPLEQHQWADGVCTVCGEDIRSAMMGGRYETILAMLKNAPNGQRELIRIALQFYEDKELDAIAKKAAAMVTDEALLMEAFPCWAKEFEAEKLKSKWETFGFSIPTSRFTAVSEDTRSKLAEILRPHLVEIAVNARYTATAREALHRLEYAGQLTKEEAMRLIPLTENSVYALSAVPALKYYNGDWRYLITKVCISTLGSMMKHGDTDARQAADLLHELYKAGVRKGDIYKFNGTVIRRGYKGSTDDDNYGYSASEEKFIVW